MIKSLGFKRVFILSIFGGLLVFLALVYFVVLVPQAESSAQELASIQAESATLQTEVEQMTSSYAFFESQKPIFEKMNRLGFFAGQDRVLARERFDSIQKMSKIISAKYEIKAASMMAEEKQTDPITGLDVPQSPFAVMESSITVSLSAIDDLDVYRFLYFLNYGFPGHLTVNSIAIERKVKLTPELLKQVGQGTPPEIITATMELTWRTMSRRDGVSKNGEPQPLNVSGGAQ